MDPEDLEAQIREQDEEGNDVKTIQPGATSAPDASGGVVTSSGENVPIMIQPHSTNGSSGPAVVPLPEK